MRKVLVTAATVTVTLALAAPAWSSYGTGSYGTGSVKTLSKHAAVKAKHARAFRALR